MAVVSRSLELFFKACFSAKAYLVQVSDVIVLQHLPRVRGVSNVLEPVRGDGARILDQDFFASGMLQKKLEKKLAKIYDFS